MRNCQRTRWAISVKLAWYTQEVSPRLLRLSFGGWRDYVVVEPISLQGEEWYVGWVTGEVNGVSRIPLKGAARLLRGRDDASFFGVNREGEQIPLQQCGHGRIGVRGPYARIPLR